MTKAIKVSQIRKGHKLVAWMGPPTVTHKPRIEGEWWTVRTDRTDTFPGGLILAHVTDIKAGTVFVVVE